MADAVPGRGVEARAALGLSHPHVVTAFDAAVAGGRHFLVMEYVAGGDMRRHVRRHGPLPVGQACECARQTALGLQHFRDCGLVHRDIKPSNIVWDPHLSTYKILDLGLTRPVADGGGDMSFSDLTQTGTMMGTPDFVAPEQIEDPRAVDIRADLYSLGCTFYYLLTGRAPFPGGTLIQKLDRHRWEEPEPVERLRPEVSPELRAVLRRLMAKRPEDRYQTPAEAALALGAVLQAGRLFFVGEARRLQGHGGRVLSVAFSPDGRRAASGAADGVVRVWDAASGKELHRLRGHEQAVLKVAWLADGLLLSGGADLDVRLWGADAGLQLRAFFTGGREIDRVAFTADGKALLTSNGGKTPYLWDVDSGQVVRRFEGHADSVYDVALSPDGRRALSAGRDRTVRVWDTATGRELGRLEGHKGPVFCATFSPDGQLALTGGWRTVRLWELAAGRELRRFEGHQLNVQGVAFCREGRRAVSGGNDGTVRLWDVATGRQLACFDGHREQVLSVAFSPDGLHALSGGTDTTARLWRLPDAPTGH